MSSADDAQKLKAAVETKEKAGDKIEKKQTTAEIEKEQEAKLRSKYGQKLGHTKPNSFLQKQLERGRNYFDSGDYNMKKASKKGIPEPLGKPAVTPAGPTDDVPVHPLPTADEIPTAEKLPVRKTSIVKSKLAAMS